MRCLDAVDPLHNQNALRGKFRKNFRHIDVRVAGHPEGKMMDIGEFYGKVNLPGKTEREFLHNCGGLMSLNLLKIVLSVDASLDAEMIFHQAGDLRENLQIDSNDILQTGALNLHHHIALCRLFSSGLRRAFQIIR